MQLKECMEDTADNKVWGDWMLINLCVLCSVQYFCLSSSLLSCSWLSKPPLKGMTKAPGSWLSTHSLIFTNLFQTEAAKLVGGLDERESDMHIHESSWTYECLQEIGLPRWHLGVWLSFQLNFCTQHLIRQALLRSKRKWTLHDQRRKEACTSLTSVKIAQ